MAFVKRDAEGRIAAVSMHATDEGMEELALDNPELDAFLRQSLLESVAKRHWVESDLGLARVLEDLIDLLIEKNVFRFHDLPEAAQKKLIERRGLRREFAYVETLFGEDADGGFGAAEDTAGAEGEDEGYL